MQIACISTNRHIRHPHILTYFEGEEIYDYNINITAHGGQGKKATTTQFAAGKKHRHPERTRALRVVSFFFGNVILEKEDEKMSVVDHQSRLSTLYNYG